MVTTSMSIAMLTVMFGIASVFTGGTAAPVLAQDTTSSSSSIEQIKVTREISAPLDKVWNIVSNIDNEAKYWPIIKNIKNINRLDNITESEVTIQAGPGRDTKTHQFVHVDPEQFVVQTNITEGPVTGSRLLTLSPSAENNATTT